MFSSTHNITLTVLSFIHYSRQVYYFKPYDDQKNKKYTYWSLVTYMFINIWAYSSRSWRFQFIFKVVAVLEKNLRNSIIENKKKIKLYYNNCILRVIWYFFLYICFRNFSFTWTWIECQEQCVRLCSKGVHVRYI